MTLRHVPALLGWGVAAALLLAPTPAAAAEDDDDARPEIVLWHAYRAREADTLTRFIQQLNQRETAYRVKVLAVPYDAFLDKITAAIPRGKGPDVFIAAHDLVGDWSEAKTISPMSDVLDPTLLGTLHDGLVDALLYKGEVYGVPLAFKSVVLWRNTALAKDAPTTTSELIGMAKARTGDGQYGLVYENGLLYYHAALLHGFGGALFDDKGVPSIHTPAFSKSLRLAMQMARDDKIVPQEVNGALVTGLFNEGRAAFIFTGPWSLGEVESKVSFALSPLPVVDGEGGAGPMKPLLTVEAAMVSGRTEQRALAVLLVRELAGEVSSRMRLVDGLQPVARISAWKNLDDALGAEQARNMRAFRAQLKNTVITPNTPAMKAMWSPTDLAIGESLGQGADPEVTLAKAQKKLEGVLAAVEPDDDAKDPTAFIILVTLLVLVALGWMVTTVRRRGAARFAADVRGSWKAYLYLAPAMVGMLVLVFVPFAFGVGMGFFKHAWGEYTFVGLSHFVNILAGSDSRFFYTLGITVLWTASNVFLHVAIGVFLALVLSQARLKMRGLYRVLFIIPWAVPNYITALIWKGMFHPEFGAINAVFGLDGFSWMNATWSAFAANLITNTWLGFPFMMVTAMGGLTAIPRDLYEAAELDGAGAIARFRHITMPLLKPTLAPAIVLGTMWTFNMFNIIYLVSGGAPGGNTDILITEAFRWAFERGQGGAFGYAASYSTLIFILLASYTIAANRVAAKVAGSKP